MSEITDRSTKIRVISILLIIIAPIISSTLVSGFVVFDGPRAIYSGIDDAFTYTVDSFQNYQFTVDVSFNETVLPSYTLIVFVTTRTEWYEILTGTKTLDNMTDYLYNQTIYHAQPVTFNVTIPDSDEWTFVFLNPNPSEMLTLIKLTQIKLTQEYTLGWLWITIMVLMIACLSSAASIMSRRRAKRKEG